MFYIQEILFDTFHSLSFFSPSCLHFCKISGGLFVFLNMRRISPVYADFSVYSGDKRKLSKNYGGICMNLFENVKAVVTVCLLYTSDAADE